MTTRTVEDDGEAELEQQRHEPDDGAVCIVCMTDWPCQAAA